MIARSHAEAGGARPDLATQLRGLFPILDREINGQRLVYLDSAATSLRPETVVQAEANFYRRHNANVHRSMHTLAAEATDLYEASRVRIARFIHAPTPDAVIFTRSATASLNLVARGLEPRLRPGDEILVTQLEHHANLVPWIQLSKRAGLRLRYIPLGDGGELDLSSLDELFTSRTRVVALAHISNVLGSVSPVERIVEAAHRRGALVVLDAAQSVGHRPVDLQALGVDYLAFSMHKLYGPMGVGVLAGTKETMEHLSPVEGGGEMIETVTLNDVSFADLPQRLEAGTPNIAGVVASAAALDLLEDIGLDRIRDHERRVCALAIDALQTMGGLRLFGPLDAERRGGLISFWDDDVHPHDMTSILDERGVAVRAGHHCAQPLHRHLGVVATTRASFGPTTTADDIQALVDAIAAARRFFR